ncbi:MAG: helix-turn-helix domain-containing protein [Thermoleophilia bacterium]
MKERGARQIDVATWAEVDQSSVSRYIDKKRTPELEVMQAIEAGFGLSPGTFFLETREARAQDIVTKAIREGVIELEDIELLIAGYRARRQEEETGS